MFVEYIYMNSTTLKRYAETLQNWNISFQLKKQNTYWNEIATLDFNFYLVLTSNMGTKANSNPRKPQAKDVISRKTVASANSMFMTTSLRHESMA
jgi:hypothetical protein